MNILILRHSADKVKSEGKRDVVTASQLEHATGYTLSGAQKSATGRGDMAYIIDRDNKIAFIAEIDSMKERLSIRKDGKKERVQDFELKNVQPHTFMDIPFVKGWETHKGVKVMSRTDFDNFSYST